MRFKHMFSNRWSEDIETSIDSNLDGFIQNPGFMGEYLAHLITGKDGNASAGAGFDLLDKEINKADEAKEIVNIRSTFCNPEKKFKGQAGCGERYLFWNKPKVCSCGIDLSNEGGSGGRAGIDARAGVLYHSQMDKYVIQVIDPKKNNKDCRLVTYRAFVIDAHNPEFFEYIKNQYENAKSNTCNFLPYAYDFYRAKPIKVIELLIDINNNVVTSLFFDLNNNKADMMPLRLLTNAEKKNIADLYNIEYNKNWNNKKMLEALADIDGKIPGNKFKLRNKSLNKNRGITNRN